MKNKLDKYEKTLFKIRLSKMRTLEAFVGLSDKYVTTMGADNRENADKIYQCYIGFRLNKHIYGVGVERGK